jgi:cysteine desulfurase
MGNLTESRVFLDASGSAPMSARTRAAFLAAVDQGWADPDRPHAESRQAHVILDGAAQAIAAVLGAPAGHLYFVPTFGLAFDRAIGGIVAARGARGTIIATSVERKPALRVASRHCDEVVQIPVDSAGVLDLEGFRANLDDSVSLALVQHANQETGVIQPLGEAHEAAHAAGVPLVVDATASIGHVDAPGSWDALLADPTDWGAPRGVAIMAFRAATHWSPMPPIVTGRVNVAVALAAAVALEEREELRAEVAPRLAKLAARIRAAAAQVPDTVVFEPQGPALPHVVTFACARIDGEALATELDRRGFAVGSGSACTADPEPESHVWQALGISAPDGGGRGIVRVGLHPSVSEDDVERFVVALRDAAATLLGGTGR